MAKRGRPPAEVETTLIRVERDIANMLRVIASIRKTTNAKIMGQHVRPIIKREYDKALEEASGNSRSPR